MANRQLGEVLDLKGKSELELMKPYLIQYRKRMQTLFHGRPVRNDPSRLVGFMWFVVEGRWHDTECTIDVGRVIREALPADFNRYHAKPIVNEIAPKVRRLTIEQEKELLFFLSDFHAHLSAENIIGMLKCYARGDSWPAIKKQLTG